MSAAQSAVASKPASREGADKVALLLLAMGPPMASQLLRHFSPEELKRIPRSATELGPVTASDLESLVEEFASQFSNGVKFLGTGGEVEELLSRSLTPEQMQALSASEPVKPPESVWERVVALPDERVLPFLAQEHPQTAALFLSKLPAANAARLAAQMPPPRRNALMRRMCSLRPVSDEAMRLLENALGASLLATAAQASGADTRARLADIVNRLDKDQIDELIASLEHDRPEDAKALKRMLFSFEDLPRLGAAARAALMDQVPADRLLLALRGADAAFQDVVLSSLASRARRMVEAELAGGETGSPREVAAARRAIAELALAMAARGEIELDAPEAGAGD